MTDINKDNAPVFHAGEVRVQERLGVADKVASFASRGIRPIMPDQHRQFFEQLPMILIGAVDAQGRPWASAGFGAPGFMASPAPDRLDVSARPLLADPLNLRLAPGDKLGLLGIELETRRRNRMNGVIAQSNANGFSLRVDQSFGNCPQYIQRRNLCARKNAKTPSITSSQAITDAAAAIIHASDMFFIASRTAEFSADPRSGVDVSHRGGRPGFVGLSASGKVLFPDFSGNRFFNTLGNITSDPRVGLFFADFENGAALFITGHARIDWDSPEITNFPGAERFIEITPEETHYATDSLPFAGEFIDQWPMLEATGVWGDNGPAR